MPVNCWGPVVGAKAVSYRTALILGCIGQAIGLAAFGPEGFRPYGPFLDRRQQLPSHPMQTMYALMWSLVVPLAWEFLALQHKIVLPMYLCSGEVLCDVQQQDLCNQSDHETGICEVKTF